MTSIGSGYDFSATTFSPDGRLFQVEYAAKATENAGTVIGITCKDGVILGVEKLVQSKLLVPGSNRRINTVDVHAGIAHAGLLADGRYLANHAREECNDWREKYHCAISGKALADRVGKYVTAHTLYDARPIGVCSLLAVMDPHHGPKLYMTEPSGQSFGYFGCAVGKGKTIARTEIEKIKFNEVTAREALREAIRILMLAHDEGKDKEMEMELSWICAETENKHKLVPRELIAQIESEIKAAQDEAAMQE